MSSLRRRARAALRGRRRSLALGGLLLGALAIAGGLAAAGGPRSPLFDAATPLLPGGYHDVLEAYSEDGLRFEVRPAPLARGADTQHQALAGGRRLLVYLGGGEEELRIKDLDSGEERPLRIEGGCGPEVTCVDPVLAPLPDGSLRLYYTAAPRGGDPADSALTTHVRSARSEDGGVTWVREPGDRRSGQGLVDPDVVALPGGGWRLYSSTAEWDGEGEPRLSVVSAVSGDGLTFTPEPGERLVGGSATATVPLPGGGWRMYYHPVHAALLSAVSEDGLTFTPEPGERIPRDPLPGARYIGAEAPGVVALSDGRWWLTFNSVREPPWPLNQWVARWRVWDAGVPPP
jgi:hypothetical protein